MPKVVLRGRGGGKTVELIKQCAEKGGYIVVPTRVNAEYVQYMVQQLGLADKVPFPITYTELLNGSFSPAYCSPLWFDNVELLLQRLGRGASIGGWSASVEMESE